MLINYASWSTGSDEEIVQIIELARDGTIDLQKDAKWKIGDTRTIRINAFTSGSNVSHVEQDIDIIITSFDDYNECGCKMQFDFKQTLAATDSVHNWQSCTGGYRNATVFKDTLPSLVKALPVWLNHRLIEFEVKSGDNDTGAIDTIPGNKLALRSEVEILGKTNLSMEGEGTQLEYYKVEENRIKTRGKNGSSPWYWWTRSPP